MSFNKLIQQLRDGNRLALSRLMTLLENDSDHVPEVMAELYPDLGKAWRVGITGPPGSGKSTLVNQLILKLRAQKNAGGCGGSRSLKPL